MFVSASLLKVTACGILHHRLSLRLLSFAVYSAIRSSAIARPSIEFGFEAGCNSGKANVGPSEARLNNEPDLLLTVADSF